MIWYPWLNIIHHQILYAFYIKKGHHAHILYSKWNNGEDRLVYFITHWLMCNKIHSMRYCNICDDCCLMNIDNHPDYYQLDLKNNMKTIGIDVVRACIDTIYQCVRYSKSKVIFIKNIENLTIEAINLLLKTLEEPPKNTYFFLKTRSYSKIPATLLSRCIKWHVHPPIEKLGLKWLFQDQKIEIDILSAQTALRLCQGSPIEASLILKSNVWDNRLKLCNIINYAIIEKDFLEILPFLNVDQCNYQSLYWLITLLLDGLKWSQGVKNFIVNLDQLKLIRIISTYWTTSSLNSQLREWLKLFHYFQKFDNINKELLLIHRLLNWQRGVVETC